MNPSARSALTLAVLLVLPQLQALCPRLAPDVISGKVIPCRYLCIKINFLELPSIILSTERDGVLCSTLLLRRRGVCKNGGCIPFGSDDDIKPKGALGKVIAAIDKFASGSYRQKPPKPGTPFGPIVSTATSLFGGGSSTTSGGTSSAASSIVATATAAAVGSSLKKLFSESSSPSSENKRQNERPTSNPFGPSLSSILKPEHPANAAGGILASGSSAVPVSFGGGPPVLPPSTEGGAEHENTHASPGTALTNPGGPSAHPALTHFNNPLPPKQKDSLSPGSPSDVSHSAGGAITKAIGLVLGNLQKMSGAPTSGIPSGQQTSGGPVVSSQHHLDSTVRDFPKTTGVAENIHIRGATGESSIPTAFPAGGITPIAQPSSSSRTGSDGKERFGGFAASAVQEGHPLITPGAPAGTSFGYKSKLPPTASSPSRLPSIESQAPSAASRAGNSAGSQLNGPYGEALARLREISRGSNRNVLLGQPSPAAFGDTSAPNGRSSAITPPKISSDHEVTNYKETGANVPRAGATPITPGFGHGSPGILPSSRGVAERHREEKPRWPEAPKKVSRPLNTAKDAAELPAGTLLRTSLPTSNTVGMTSPSVGISPLNAPPTPTSGSSSGTLINISLVKPLKTLKQVAAGTTPAISVGQPSSAVPGVSSAPANDSPIGILRKGVNEPEVKPTKKIAAAPPHGNPTQAAVELNGSALPNLPSTLAAAEKKVAKVLQTSPLPNMSERTAVIVANTANPDINDIRGPSEISSNKPTDKPSPSIGSSRVEHPAAFGSRSAISSQAEGTLGSASNTLKRVSGSTIPTTPFRKPPPSYTDNTSKPSIGSRIQSLHKDSTTPELKTATEKPVGQLDGNRTPITVELGGAAPSIAHSTLALTDSAGAEASRLSTAPSKISRPTLNAVKPAEASITNVRGPSQISTTKHANGPSPPIGRTGLKAVAASRSTTTVRSRMRKTFRRVFRKFRRGRKKTNFRFRKPSRVAANDTSKPSGSSSIQRIHKGASHPVSHPVIPSKKPSLVALNEKLKPMSSLNEGANGHQKGFTEAGKKKTRHGIAATIPAVVGEQPPIVQMSTRKIPKSNFLETAQKPAAPALRPVNAALGTAEAGVSRSGTPAQPPSRDIANIPLPSMQTDAVKLTTSSQTAGSLEIRPHIQPAPGITPSAKAVAPKADAGTSKQINDSRANGLRSTATARRTEPSIRGFVANPQLPSSTLSNTPLPSTETVPVGPTTSSRAPSSLQSTRDNSPGPGSSPSSKKLLGADAQTSKQRNDSQAHSSHTAATARSTKTNGSQLPLPDAALRSQGAPLLSGGELVEKTSTSRTLTLSKNTVPGKLDGHTNEVPDRMSQKNTHSVQMGSSALPVTPGGTTEPPSLPENRKDSARTPSDSGSNSSNLRPVTGIITNNIRHPMLKLQKYPRVDQSTRDRGVKESVPSYRNLNPTKPETGALLTLGVQGLRHSTLPEAVVRAVPNPLSTPPNNKERSSLPLRSNTEATKSSHGGTRIINKSFTNSLTKINDNRLLKRKENTTGTYNGQESPKHNVKSSLHDVVDAGPASGSIADKPATVPISPVKSTLQVSAVQGSKEGLALGHYAGERVPATLPSGTVTYSNPNNIKNIGSVNTYNNNSPPTMASSTAEAPRNTVLPSGTVPSTHGSAFAATATGAKDASPSMSRISHVDTAATPAKPTATTGTALNAHSGNKIAAKPIAGQADQAPAVAGTSKSRNSPHGSNQGSETRTPRGGENFYAKSSPSSQSTPSSSGRVESKMSPNNDNPFKARSVTTLKSKDDTSSLASEKRSFSSAAQTVSIQTLVSKSLRVHSASSVPAVNAAKLTAGASESTGATGKHTLTTGLLSSIKSSVSTGRAQEGVKTSKPSPGTAPKTKGNVYNSRTSGPQAGLNASATSRLATPNSEAPGATSGSTVSVPSTAEASNAGSRNPVPETSRNAATKAENVTRPGSPSNLAAPENVEASRLTAVTTAKKGVQDVRPSTTPLGAKAHVSEGNASTNAETPGGSAGSLPALTLRREKIVSSPLVALKKALNSPPKPSGIVKKLGSFLPGARNALRFNVHSRKPTVANLPSEVTKNKEESAVTERPPTVAQSPTQPTDSEKYPSKSTSVASGDMQTAPTANGQQSTPPLYAGMQPPGGIVFGRHSPMPGGFWGPPQGMPGMFRPF